MKRLYRRHCQREFDRISRLAALIVCTAWHRRYCFSFKSGNSLQDCDGVKIVNEPICPCRLSKVSPRLPSDPACLLRQFHSRRATGWTDYTHTKKSRAALQDSSC